MNNQGLKIITLFSIFCLFVCRLSFSQADSVTTFILPELKITQIEKGSQVVYNFENRHNRFVFDHSFLRADTTRYKYNVSVQDIVKVSVRNGTHFWDTAEVGGILGYTLGFFFWGYFTLGDETPKFHPGAAVFGGFAVGVPFALIFGIIGLLAPNYDDYYIGKLSSDKKESFMLWLLKKNRFRPGK